VPESRCESRTSGHGFLGESFPNLKKASEF
jgi:hypothetical protein